MRPDNGYRHGSRTWVRKFNARDPNKLKPTTKQLDYIDELAATLGRTPPRVDTKTEASDVIEALTLARRSRTQLCRWCKIENADLDALFCAPCESEGATIEEVLT